MGILQRFENRLEQMVSGAFAKAFRSAVQPVEVAAALQREVDNSAQILSRNRRLVPNQFHVELSPQDYARLAPYSSTLADELVEMLRDHAHEQSYVFTGPVSISFDKDDELGTGRFRVRSSALARVTPAGESSDPSVTEVATATRTRSSPSDPRCIRVHHAIASAAGNTTRSGATERTCSASARTSASLARSAR